MLSLVGPLAYFCKAPGSALGFVQMGEQAMGVNARSVRPPSGAAQRRLRNYLLDSRFQLKYTGMVVGVTLIVASLLGAVAYQESKGQTEALQIQLAVQPDLDPQVAAHLDAFGKQRDRQMLLGILGGIMLLTLALGATGIVITHKLVGPAYRMRRLLGTVASGHLRVEGALRKGDEIAQLDAALAKAKAHGISNADLEPFQALRDRMQSQLD
jgi:hypothetical protein